jgi:uncharacterized phage infection (PIP) family protein YhgE
MADRTIEQINVALERLEQVSANNTRNLAELQVYVAQVAGTVERIAIGMEQRLTQQDQMIQQMMQTHEQRLNRQDQLIALLSSYITGALPNQANGA